MFSPSKRELLRLIERERTAHRLELANLLDRLASATGTPWTPPPADVANAAPAVAQTWIISPEQQPL